MQSKLTLSTVYRKEYLYTVDPTDTSLTPFQVLFRALSIRDLDYIRNFDDIKQHELNIAILQKSLLRFFNVTDEKGNILSEPNISILTYNQIAQIAQKVFSVSVLTKEVKEKIKLNVNLSMNKKFETDTWDCEVCQHKGLDKQRNCKFRDDYDKLFVTDLNIMVGDVRYNYCPMYHKDNKLLADIFGCYNAIEKGVLPEVGGTVDQTEFFSYATDVVRKAVNDKYDKESKE